MRCSQRLAYETTSIYCLLGSSAAVLPVWARAQQPPVPIIGFLSSFSSNARFKAAFKRV